MKWLGLIAALAAVWTETALLWLVGWWAVLLFSVRDGPQDPFDRSADIWLVLGLVAMTGAVVATGLWMTRTIVRRLVR